MLVAGDEARTMRSIGWHISGIGLSRSRFGRASSMAYRTLRRRRRATGELMASYYGYISARVVAPPRAAGWLLTRVPRRAERFDDLIFTV